MGKAARSNQPSHRRVLAGLALVALSALAGCGTTTTAEESPDPRTGTTATTLITGLAPEPDADAGEAGTSTAAKTTVTVDGMEAPDGTAVTARCTRTVDDTTNRPIIRLTLENQHHRPVARVTLSDDQQPVVFSAIVFQGDGAALIGVEGQDGSTLRAERDRNNCVVTGSVKDEAEGTAHLMELRAACDVS